MTAVYFFFKIYNSIKKSSKYALQAVINVESGPLVLLIFYIHNVDIEEEAVHSACQLIGIWPEGIFHVEWFSLDGTLTQSQSQIAFTNGIHLLSSDDVDRW